MKRFLFPLAAFLFAGGGLRAQEIVVGADFTTRFDNREYASNTFDESKTLFSARLSPRVGVQWDGKNRLVFGVDLLQHFGDHEKFLSDAKPLMYYRFHTEHVQAYAGIFDRKALMGDYSRAFFSDSMTFYSNRIAGFLGGYRSTARRRTYVEFGIDWEGMYSHASREKFRILSAGRYSACDNFFFGYAFSMFHFAGSKEEENVTDNLLINPFVGTEFKAYFDFDIRAGFLFAPQRVRRFAEGWKKPCGGQIDFKMTRWGVKLENTLYFGENLMPYYAVHGAELYAGERFYSTTEHIYNRTMLGYERSFFDNSVRVEAGMIFHYDGTGLGTQQMVKLSVDIEKMFNIGRKKSGE